MPVADGLLLVCEHDVVYSALIVYTGKSVLQVFDFMQAVHDTDVVRHGPAIVGTCQVCASTNSDSVDSSLVDGGGRQRMSDMYRITTEEGLSVRVQSPHEHGFTAEEAIAAFVSLKEIEPVEPCVHGNYARHIIEASVRASLMVNNPADALAWCDGKPKGNSDG